jgi:AraC-like DNA-binding protein
MTFRIVHPSGFLKKFVKQYCFMETDVHEGNVMERVIPTENVQLMFHYKNPFVVFHSNNKLVTQPRSIISGLSHSFSDVSTNGESGVVFISFYPTGACHFFDFPLSEIENQSIDMSDVLGNEIGQIEETLYFANTIEEKTGIIESFLLRRYSPIPSHDYLLLQKGIDIIKWEKGQSNAVTLSDSLATSPKTLERKFARYLGKTTKQMIKLIRFQQILHNLSSCKTLSLTNQAYLNGYFDQSHFIHDFKTFSGYTPKEFLIRYPDFNINSDAC